MSTFGAWGEPKYEHRNGLEWHEAPIPWRLHRCSPWTTCWLGLEPVFRCACGSISRDGRYWSERNSRKRAPRRSA